MSKPCFFQRCDDHLKRLWIWLADSRAAPKKPALPASIHGIMLSEEPAAFAVWDYVFENAVKNRPDFWEQWRGKPLLVVVMRTWETGTMANLEPLMKRRAEHQRDFPMHTVIVAVNAESELQLCAEAGIEAVWCNHNAHVDACIYKPLDGAKAGDAREFDAIYDARFARYKRNDLAAKVEKLALVHYTAPSLFEALWTLKMRRVLRHANILNSHRWGIWPVFLNRKAVAAGYNRARVGLCLSPVEGAMLASIQYLLCGLPVVTTPNRGGRDDFFDEENSIEVAAEPEAVAAGVRTLIERRVDPWVIREKTRVRMAEHRARLVALVEEFQRAHGVTGDRLLSQVQPPRMRNGFSDKLG